MAVFAPDTAGTIIVVDTSNAEISEFFFGFACLDFNFPLHMHLIFQTGPPASRMTNVREIKVLTWRGQFLRIFLNLNK